MDEITERLVVVNSRASVVRLSPAFADLLSRPLAAGRRLALVTDDSSRITIGLRAALVAAGGVWAVRCSGHDYRDGLTGLSYATLDAVGDPAHPSADDSAEAEAEAAVEAEAHAESRRAEAEAAAALADGTLPEKPLPGTEDEFALQLGVDVTLLHTHEAPDDGFLGVAVEAMADAIGGYAPAAWGLTEPLERGWDRWAMTQEARHRLPTTSRLVIEGPHLSASVTARATDLGLEETIALTADVPGGATGLDAAIERLALSLANLTRTALPTFALVLARWGEDDRSFRPVAYPPPNPVALLIGAPSVALLDLHEAVFAPEQPVLVVGQPLEPAYLLPLGSSQRSGWEALHDALDSVGTARLTTLVDPGLLQAWDDDLQGDLDHTGEPHPHDAPLLGPHPLDFDERGTTDAP